LLLATNHGPTNAHLRHPSRDEGGAKAELVSVGQSGEQSLKRIESAGERASGGLKGLGPKAELLRTDIRTPGGVLIGVTLHRFTRRAAEAAHGTGDRASILYLAVLVGSEPHRAAVRQARGAVAQDRGAHQA
jgi:hypothetical protein